MTETLYQPTPSQLMAMPKAEQLAWELALAFDMKLTIHDFSFLVLKLTRFKNARD